MSAKAVSTVEPRRRLGRSKRQFRESLWVLGPYLPPRAKSRLVVLTVMSFIGGLLEAAVVVVVVNAAFALVNDSNVTSSLPIIGELDLTVPQSIWLGVVMLVARLAIQVVNAHVSTKLSSDSYTELRGRVHRGFLYSNWDLQSREGESQLQDLVSTHAPQVAITVLTINNFLVATTNFGALLLSAFIVDAAAAMSIVVAVTVLFFCFRPIGNRIRSHATEQLVHNADYVQAVSQGVRLSQEIKTFDVREAWAATEDRYSELTSAAYMKKNRLRALLGPLYQGFALGMLLAGLGALYYSGQTELASLGALVLILLRAMGNGQQIQGGYQGLVETIPFATHLHDRLTTFEAARSETGGDPLPDIETLGARGLTFAYEPGHPVLHDVTFEVTKGEAIGIVGPSGGGKSTLVQLLLRLRETEQGAILVNGLDASQYSLSDWYRHVTLVAQEARLTGGTIRENIAFFREGITDEQIERAATRASIHKDIITWPGGYEASAGARGSGLSGGQRQRLCIARALVTDPDVLILDEPTSALDMDAEAIVRETLETLRGETTVLLVAHRMSTLAHCDRIMVIEDGRIVAFDAASDLAEHEGFYRRALEQKDQ